MLRNICSHKLITEGLKTALVVAGVGSAAGAYGGFGAVEDYTAVRFPRDFSAKPLAYAKSMSIGAAGGATFCVGSALAIACASSFFTKKPIDNKTIGIAGSILAATVGPLVGYVSGDHTIRKNSSLRSRFIHRAYI